MKRLVALVLVVALLFGIWWMFFKKTDHVSGPKQEPLKVKLHSDTFNKSITTAMNGYFNLKDAFVEADTSQVKNATTKFLPLIDSIKIDELKKDTSGILESAQTQLAEIKTNAEAILKENDLTEMRHDFQMVSEGLYPLLKTVHYQGPNLYWQNCPMAFGDDKPANWLSNTLEIVNPYMGKKHPEYKSGMLHCGEVKDTIK